MFSLVLQDGVKNIGYHLKIVCRLFIRFKYMNKGKLKHNLSEIL